MKTFHLDLSDLSSDADLHLTVGAHRIPVQEHNDRTLAAAGGDNRVVGSSALARANLTHFATADPDQIGDGHVQLIQLTRAPEPGVPIGRILRLTHHISDGALRSFFRSQIRYYAQPVQTHKSFYFRERFVRPKVYSSMLAGLGFDDLPDDPEEALDLLVASNAVVNATSTAGSLVALNPDLASIQPYTQSVVLYDHILGDPRTDPAQFNNMQLLTQAIREGGDYWSPVIPCTDKDGNPIKADYDFRPEEGGWAAGQQMYTATVLDPVGDAMVAPISRANLTASNDTRLKGKTWSPAAGQTAVARQSATTPGPVPAARAAAAAGVAFKWTVNEQTHHYGVSVDADSIKVDDKENFTIDASNNFSRTLFAGYQLLDDKGGKIGGIERLYSISAVNAILGIPVPTDPTSLAFNLKSAPQADILFGSLGVTDWEGEVSDYGALLTGLWQYGVPGIFIIAGKALTSTATFNRIVNDRDLMAAAIGVAFPIVGGGAATAAALTNTKKVLFSLANTALGFLVKKGLEKLAEYIATQVAAGAISNAFGPVGLIFKAASVAVGFTQIAVTTVEVLASPATVRVRVARAIDVALTMHPDPKHGEAGNPATAVWPAIGTRYEAILQYRDGTNFILKGPLPATTSSDPIGLTFETVPAGGQFKILFGVYSANGWLAGSWESDWITATPNSGTTLDLGNANIAENIVPLAGDTQYLYKERIAYLNDVYRWEVGTAPTETLRALDCGDQGTLCEPVAITINNSAFQVGYVWRASGQNLSPDDPKAPPSGRQLYNVQNLSVLADPNSRLITSEVGFTLKPQIAYAATVGDGKQINQQNFVLDPRGGGNNLRRVELSAGREHFGFADPDEPSWSRFPLDNLDALAVHPSNLVIGASFKDQKMLLAPLPFKPSPDDKAEVAFMVSGDGIRQGLMRGPVAMAAAPDGRILVLESLNNRVQAFDTKGNPVPSFTFIPSLFSLVTADVAQDLDRGVLPAGFVAGLVAQAQGFTNTVPGELAGELDEGRYRPCDDPLIEALTNVGVDLAYDPENLTDPKASAQIAVIEAGQSWSITDPRGFEWRLSRADDEEISIFAVPHAPQVQTIEQGTTWLVTDQKLGQSWRIEPSSADESLSLVKVALSYFPLKGRRAGSTYLDMGVEAQGHVYVLSYLSDGTKATDYYLDIYTPQGVFLSQTPDPSVSSQSINPVLAKLCVSVFRDVYALGFGKTAGIGGRPEPTISHWVPTPPLFSLDVSLQKPLNDQNITVVAQAFAGKGVILSSKAAIEVVDREGAWTIKDVTVVYHVYRTGDSIQVYDVPA
ncbi:hypothetical protein [Jiella sonneratiae]|uniref:Tip attachment protein J domain-containing protein n=1 Tax=Jiella sonneratiae TaxID=2816856 RepID=A0ABS3IXN0_9HYPH|nr:hypothetical protein [Jiella sonneratiae]MBO0902174.1 hypothetical protein [Jiella sonneratiae]